MGQSGMIAKRPDRAAHRNARLMGMPRLDLSPMAGLPYLETLTLSEDMREAAKALEGESIRILYQ